LDGTPWVTALQARVAELEAKNAELNGYLDAIAAIPEVDAADGGCERCGAAQVDGGSVGFYCPTKGCFPKKHSDPEAMVQVRGFVHPVPKEMASAIEVLLAEIDRPREALRDLVCESEEEVPSRSTWKRAHNEVFRTEVAS
jgi:hypothetical protein